MTTCTTNLAAAPSRSTSRRSFWQWLITAFAARKQRRDLANLDPHLLNDIGLSREAAAREANRKLWDVPQHWLQ